MNGGKGGIGELALVEDRVTNTSEWKVAGISRLFSTEEHGSTIISHPDLGELMTRFLFPRGMHEQNL